MTPNPELQLDYLPRLPQRKDWRIGCIGAGFIMSDCHLVAYRQGGFNPCAIAAPRREQAQAAAQRHRIDKVHADVDALLADTSIEVIDIAVPPDRQPELIRRAVERRGNLRGILAQKPLALSLREARACVELCRQA